MSLQMDTSKSYLYGSLLPVFFKNYLHGFEIFLGKNNPRCQSLIDQCGRYGAMTANKRLVVNNTFKFSGSLRTFGTNASWHQTKVPNFGTGPWDASIDMDGSIVDEVTKLTYSSISGQNRRRTDMQIKHNASDPPHSFSNERPQSYAYTVPDASHLGDKTQS